MGDDPEGIFSSVKITVGLLPSYLQTSLNPFSKGEYLTRSTTQDKKTKYFFILFFFFFHNVLRDGVNSMTKLGIHNQSINLKQQFFTLLALKRPQT